MATRVGFEGLGATGLPNQWAFRGCRVFYWGGRTLTLLHQVGLQGVVLGGAPPQQRPEPKRQASGRVEDGVATAQRDDERNGQGERRGIREEHDIRGHHIRGRDTDRDSHGGAFLPFSSDLTTWAGKWPVLLRTVLPGQSKPLPEGVVGFCIQTR